MSQSDEYGMNLKQKKNGPERTFFIERKRSVQYKKNFPKKKKNANIQ